MTIQILLLKYKEQKKKKKNVTDEFVVKKQQNGEFLLKYQMKKHLSSFNDYSTYQKSH